MADIRKHYIQVKKALTKNRCAEPFWASRYKFSPYHACQHGCLYCDGRAEKYYVEGEFDRDIKIRKNLPELMQIELGKIREKGIISGGSGVSDIYQPIEKEEKITRKCAEAILKHNFPAAVATKSSLILDDFDIWSEIAKKTGFIFMTSLITADENIRQDFEPGASSVQERLDTLKKLKDAGASVGVLAMPLLPGVCDSEKSIRELFTTLKEIPVDFVIPANLTLRPGVQKELYFRKIEENYPELLSFHKKLYSENRSSGNCIYSYREELYKIITRLLKETELCPQIPHKVYSKMLMKADEIHVLLCHMEMVYQMDGINTESLVKARNNYSKWLDEQRRHFNRSRKLEGSWVDENLFYLFETGQSEKVLQNPKLNDFLKQIVFDNKIFDYQTKQLI